MLKLKKIPLIFFLVIFLALLILSSFSFAREEGEPLEIEYPEVFGEAPLTTKTFLPKYVKYIFNFSIMIAGSIAFGALIYGGFRYITSVGAPTAQTEAKDQIFAGIIGLAILLSSYLILTTINPQLKVIKVAKKPPEEWSISPFAPPGVYLATENYNEGDICTPENGCLYISEDISDFGDLGGKFTKIRFTNPVDVNTAGYHYAAVLYGRTNFNNDREGSCRIFLSPERGGESDDWTDVKGEDKWGKIDHTDVFSITVFKKSIGEDSKVDVKLCTEPAPTEECTEPEKTVSRPEKLTDDALYAKDGGGIKSIQLEENNLVVLFGSPQEEGPYGRCQVFKKGSFGLGDLENVPMGQCDPKWINFWANNSPCARYYAIYSTK